MNQKQINKQILERLEKIERTVFPQDPKESAASTSKKPKTLAELIFGRKFKNGQEKIAVIVGYLEKLQRKPAIKEVDIKQEWKNGKFEGNYANELLRRATRNLVRDCKDGIYDLSQTGEKFFDNFLKLDVRNN
jgi:hypothetical protein